MFTGIVQSMGRLSASEQIGGDRRLVLACDPAWLEGARIGDSIAVSGVCLTVVEYDADSFSADVSNETLGATSLGRLEPGARVNLEKALALGQSLDGHLVSGHVDAPSEVLERYDDARSVRLSIALPESIARYVAPKGSVTVDGVSLTVNEVGADRFGVNIVPHTRDVTVIGDYRVGTPVNLEVDLIARYVARLLEQGGGALLAARETK